MGKRKVKAPEWGPWYEGSIPEEAMAMLREAGMEPERIAVNRLYQVHVRRVPCEVIRHEYGEPVLLTHLSIKRSDRNPIHDWRVLQRIKNELTDPECEAVELYPAESRLTDSANQYHLWVLPKGMPWPFGFFGMRFVVDSDGAEVTGAKQRPFDQAPADALTKEQANELIRKRLGGGSTYGAEGGQDG